MTIQPTSAPVWQDGDPTMEAIAAAVWEHCEKQHGSGIVIDDPRNIAAAAVAGIRDAARTASGQQPKTTVITPEEGVEEARKAIQHVLEIFLDRVPRAELEADIMADSIADALSDELEDVYGRLARAEAALAAVGQPAEAHDTNRAEPLVHVGWWCWRGDNHGHLATRACRSDNVPIHVPADWATSMEDVIQRLEDGDEDHAAPAVGQPEAHTTDRATALREAAEVSVRAARACGDSEAGQYAASVAAGIGKELRRMAEEART